MSTRAIAQTGRSINVVWVFHLYVWLVMAGLLIQGAGSFILRQHPSLTAWLPVPLATLMNGNIPHAILHIAWGAAGLVILTVFRSDLAYLRLGGVFGVFYTLLGFLGIFVLNPFGMRLGWPENTFHLTVGPIMILLTYLAWRATSLKSFPQKAMQA